MERGRWTKVSSEAKDLIEALLDKSPNTRMTAKKSLEHKFFAPISEQKLTRVRGMQLNHEIFQ